MALKNYRNATCRKCGVPLLAKINEMHPICFACYLEEKAKEVQ